ncbi:MAG TPA: hypothetical protein VNZ49_14665 [Bacteroidia bacterium]|jgi:hypothetical protein|nr:hypothetical protein [Bacteroidia bacterium]
MNLSFIYINNYRNIQGQNFNLDAEYNFSFDPDSREVKCNRNPKYIQGYFESKNPNGKSIITNVTAVIGQNGSGKSSFLEFVGMIFKRWDNFHPGYALINDVVIYRVGSDVTILYGKTESKKKINKDEEVWVIEPVSMKELSTEHHDFSKDEQNNQSIKEHILPIYYSASMLDRFHETGVDQWDVVNVSNTYMYYASQIPIQVDRIRNTKYRRLTHPSNFKFEDGLRQVVFLNENHTNKFLPTLFHTHKYFSISIRQAQTNENTFITLFLNLFDEFTPQDDLEFLQLQFLTAICHGLVHPNSNYVPVNSEKEYKELFSSSLQRKTSLKETIIYFLQKHPLRDTKEKMEFVGNTFYMYDFRLREKEQFVDYLFESFTNKSFKNLSDVALRNFKNNLHGTGSSRRAFFNPFRYDLKLEQGQKLCELYLNQLEDLTPDFIEINFDLSAGETGFINLFSRFFYGFSDKIKAVNPEGIYSTDRLFRKILVLIDEAEVYFHPQWQKQYLKLLLAYFENIFDGIPVQVIITSNSPFITAELPAYNVIFLEPNEQGKSIVSPKQNHKNTLGANVYQLYQDAFYFQNGFMGDLADDKVHEVLEILNYTKGQFELVSDNKRKYIEKLIENWGEPGLKRRMEEMYQELVSKRD